MKKNNLNGFEIMTIEEQNAISAGEGITSLISSIGSTISSTLSGFTTVADDISNTIIKNKIIAKMDNVQKGEVEVGKGTIKLKWDSLSNSTGNNSTIIF